MTIIATAGFAEQPGSTWQYLVLCLCGLLVFVLATTLAAFAVVFSLWKSLPERKESAGTRAPLRGLAAPPTARCRIGIATLLTLIFWTGVSLAVYTSNFVTLTIALISLVIGTFLFAGAFVVALEIWRLVGGFRS